MSSTLRSITDVSNRCRAGTLISDRFLLRQLLGSGGFGDVWLAEDTRNSWSQGVALKLLRPTAVSKEAVARFTREMTSLELLRPNPYIVTLYERGEHEGQLFMVMEHVSGVSLATFLDACRASGTSTELRQVYQWFNQVCQALGAAHSLRVPGPITHRDIKPSNIMLARMSNEESIAKVLDFGVARLGGRQNTQSGEPLGTPGYMSPEQASGDSNNLQPTSDVFSLGLLLVEMLTLRLDTLDGTPLASLMVQSPERLKPTLAELRPEVPGAVWDVVTRALQPQIAQRYRDAEQLRQAFLDAVQDLYIAPPLGALLPMESITSSRIIVRPPDPLRALPLGALGGILLGLISLVAGVRMKNQESLRWAPEHVGTGVLGSSVALGALLIRRWKTRAPARLERALLSAHAREVRAAEEDVRERLFVWCAEPSVQNGMSLLTGFEHVAQGAVVVGSMSGLRRGDGVPATRALRVAQILSEPKSADSCARLREALRG